MKQPKGPIVLISLIVALGGFLMGFDASVISGVIRFIEPEFGLSKIELGWVVSSLTLTATLAMLTAGPLSDRWGRKNVLSIAAVLYALSAIFSALAPSFIVLVAARMLGGLGVGASLIIAPMYIAEIAPAKIRGTLVSFNQLNIVIGISAAFFTNYLILKLGQSGAGWTQSLGLETHNWRWMLGLEALPAVVYFFALFSVPQSPRWLLMHKREDEARHILQKVNGSENASKELIAVKESLLKDAGKKRPRLQELFNPALRSVLVIGIGLAILQQITGINSVFFYAPMIFEQSGLGVNASFSQAIFVGITNLVFTVVALALIDKIGRKPLLTIGVTGIAVSMFVLAYGFHSATYQVTENTVQSLNEEFEAGPLNQLKGTVYKNDRTFKADILHIFGPEAEQFESQILAKSIRLNATLILAAILGFVASFAVSIGPVMWVLFSELFPNRVRAVAISFVGFINSVVSFSVQLLFPWELSRIGTAPTFLLYALFAVAGIVFILMKVPETKGKSLEELQTILVDKKTIDR